MPSCPHCHNDIVVRELPHPGLFANYRICPNCEGRFTVDHRTKRNQAVALVIALACLALTILLYSRGSEWLVPALISYVALSVLIYWGNKHVRFVAYGEADSDRQERD